MYNLGSNQCSFYVAIKLPIDLFERLLTFIIKKNYLPIKREYA